LSGYPELDQIENALASAAARRAARRAGRSNPRRFALVAALSLALIIGAAAIAGASGAGPLASELDGLFGPDAAPPTPAVTPAGASEVKHSLGVAESQGGRVLVSDDSSEHLSVYAYAKNGSVCLVVNGVGGTGGIGHCESYLREAGGHLSVDLGVVDSHAFVWGLAGNGVARVTVTIAGQDYPTTLAHNAYFAALPSQAVASHPITVTAHLSDGATRVQHAPGLPLPSVRPVAAITTP
jgi:hypothetical protein